ncbi:MAG: response regulator [Deltaproteobacteria bacterium]|nr:response regulator [Deltaproteobacteria bacterium]
MSPAFPPVLLNLVAAGLFLGLVALLSVRRPPGRLWLPLLAFQFFLLLYIVGDTITLSSTSMFWEQVGIAVLYSGSLPAAVACWLVAIRYAEAQGCPFPWAGLAWLRIPVALTAVAWLATVTNAWHGRVLLPVIGAHNEHLWPWYPLMGLGYVQTTGAVLLLGSLAWRGPERSVRRNAAVMALAVAVTLCFNFLSYVVPSAVPFDLTIAGLCVTGVVFLYGAYRTGLFLLLPVASRQILHHDFDGLLIATSDARVHYVNPAAFELLDIETPPPDANVFALLAARLRDAAGGVVRAADLEERLRREPADAEGVTFRLAGGDERWLRISFTAIPSRRGRVVALSLRLSDVTEAQRAAAILRRAHDELERRVAERTEELRTSEERYRAVSELSSDASFAFRINPDLSLTMEWSTRALERVTGFTLEEVEAQGWEPPVHPQDRAQLRRDVAPLRQGGSATAEFRILTRAAQVRWLELQAASGLRESGGALRVVGTLRDITERKQAEFERRMFEAQIEQTQRLESLGVLAGGIAHDFNNVLAVVLGNSALLLEELKDDPALRRRVERVRSAGQYAKELTDQMLAYAGKASPKISQLNLGALLDETADLLQACAAGKCALVIEPPAGLLPIEADPTQVRQVMVNLVTNACEAVGEGGGRVCVRAGQVRADRTYLSTAVGAAALREGEYVYLEVSDNGAGMDEDTQRRIFEPFFTTRFSGRGLGLAAVLGIVRAHSGAIKLTSAPGRGTSFRVLFPRAAGVAANPEAPRRPAGPAPREATVLVADDDEAVLEVASLLLEREGFRVQAAAGGRAAIERFHAHATEIDVVVLDLSMPDVDGLQALQAIRARRPGVPVVLISGFTAKQAAERWGEAEPPACFLCKPYEPEDLVDRIRELL